MSIIKNATVANKSFPVVAIGCSAGGLEAVIELLNHLTPTTDMAYVLIQHLDPNHESMLPAIISRKTKMKVKQVENKMLMEPDQFYIIPADMDMELTDGHFLLEPRQNKPAHMPIDKFFISLAEIKGENAIGVVLSGGANDGTRGLRAIREADGLTIAQDDSAKFQSMPRSAIAEGVVDMVLSPENIAHELIRLGNYLKDLKEATNANETEVNDKQELQEIFQQLKVATQVDFNHYKLASISRRVRRRMLLFNIGTVKEYSKYIEDHKGELQLLYGDILINVTKFFRDADTYKYLRSKLITQIYKNKHPDEPIRIWVPACSTGQEAYSIAIIICEVIGETALKETTQIFATDLSEQAINKARLGVYSKSDVAEVSPERLQHFFDRTDGHYRICKTIRDVCVFAPHNVLKDPPFSRIDLISCCNLFIYLDNEWQKKVLDTFHYALNSSGYLILSKSETIGNSGKFFKQIDTENKVNIYRSDVSIRQALHSYPAKGKNNGAVPYIPKGSPAPSKISTISQVVDQLLLSDYVIPSVIINHECEIIQFRGSTGTFLEPASGTASLNLLKMARPGLRVDLRTAIHKCIKTGSAVRKDGLEVKIKSTVYPVSIEVVPVNMSPDLKYLLVLFIEYPALPKGTSTTTSGKKLAQQELENEIVALREDMTAIIEDREAANEELQTANEEIISSNEELHTVNEELQTSKEEIESSNEELSTINEQLQVRNEQLNENQEYTDGIIATIAEAMIVVDKNLIVRSANESFYKIFETTPENTEGYYLFDLGNGQWNIPRLRELLLDIIPKKGVFHGFEVNHEFPGIGHKIMSLNARLLTQRMQKTELIFIAIQDISAHVKAAKLAKEEEWFHNMANNAPVMIWIANIDKQRTFFNNTWLEFTGRPLELEIGNGWTENLHPDDVDMFMKIYNGSFEKRISFKIEYRLRRHDGVYRWALATCKPNFYDGKFAGFIGTCTDINDQKMFEQELEQKVKERTEDLLNANDNLKRSNMELEQYAYIASHDLQEPLRKIQTFSDILQSKYKDDLPEQSKEYIDKIVNSSQRMTLLIENLLNFSSVSNSDELHMPTALNEILTDVIEDFDLPAISATISYEHLPVINAVPLQMKQLFHNLISNSIKFRNENESLKMVISSAPLLPEEVRKYPALDKTLSYLEITFKDNGIGFSQEYAEQIFVIFKRLHGKQSYKGTGIGLALCRKIMANHHGEIFAESGEGGGATFYMIFPVR